MNEISSPNENTSPVPRPKTRWVALIVLLVVLILLAAGIVCPRFDSVGPAQNAAAKTQIAMLETALGAFQVDNGNFPPGTNGLVYLMQRPSGATNWRGPYMERGIPRDPWGHEYIYECPGRHNPQGYDLSAVGPDGHVFGNWKDK